MMAQLRPSRSRKRNAAPRSAPAVADLFGGRPEDVAAAAEIVRELNRELRMREGVYPRFVDQGKLTREDAERRCIVLGKALRHHEAIQAYWQDRTALVREVATVLGKGAKPTAGLMVAADDALQVVERWLRLGNVRLIEAGPSAGGEARRVSA